jgi:hypothetical protein
MYSRGRVIWREGAAACGGEGERFWVADKKSGRSLAELLPSWCDRLLSVRLIANSYLAGLPERTFP